MTTDAKGEILFERTKAPNAAAITAAISCFNYGREALEALNSLLAQTEDTINVVITDDQSRDNSVALILEWLTTHQDNDKFASVHLVRHLLNQGLSRSRNTALSLVSTPYIFILDADNQLYPRALKVLREALENSDCAMSYSLIEKFGSARGISNTSPWMPETFSYRNYIDAMALIKTDVLRQLGGYRVMPNKFGWEDYDLWCSFVDHGLKGCYVPQILCRYRTHGGSMLRNFTNRFVTAELESIRKDFEAHHKMQFFIGVSDFS